MKYSFRCPAGPALALALGSLLLASCATKDPVAVGQQIANRLCTQHAAVAELNYKADEQLIAELRAGTIKTKQQYQDRARALRQPVHKADSLNEKVVEASLAELKSTFTSPADQAIAAQQVLRLVDRCDSADDAQQKRRPRLSFRELTAHLTGPDPMLQPGPDGLPPPPPPANLPLDTTNSQP